MKIQTVKILNFRCFGPEAVSIDLEPGITAFVGNNGSGKTAVLQALSRMFGITHEQRTIKRQDFHIPANQQDLQSDSTLNIEVVIAFPEFEDTNEMEESLSIPEFFNQMVVSEPEATPIVRMNLRATWTDDGTPDGFIDQSLRWITTSETNFNWEDCPVVHSERGAIQLIYLPANRDVSIQVKSLLRGRLWQAAKWSQLFQQRCERVSERIQRDFSNETPAQFIINYITKRWEEVYKADTYSTPLLRLVNNSFQDLIRKAEFTFSPDEAGQERNLNDLSDGQRSLFHIALTAATLEAESDAIGIAPDESPFETEKLHRVCLTILAIEEPENSLSPFFLSRIIRQAREIAKLDTAQVALSSHSPAILSRIEPVEVRYFKIDSNTRQSSINKIKMPTDNVEARKFVRLAVRAFPELYFARFVILGEGDTERLVIPRIAEANNIQLDPSFVAIVPLGGRYVNYFWDLLSDLEIPFATLLDCDLGRWHGGTKIISDIIKKLQEYGNDFSTNSNVLNGDVELEQIKDLSEEEFFVEYGENLWLRLLEKEGVFFSYPLDIDFSLLSSFPDQYKVFRQSGRTLKNNSEIIERNKDLTLKKGGKPDIYNDSYDDEFRWYPYLFLNHSKPETHMISLSRINNDDLFDDAPPELKALIEYVNSFLEINGTDE